MVCYDLLCYVMIYFVISEYIVQYYELLNKCSYLRLFKVYFCVGCAEKKEGAKNTPKVGDAKNGGGQMIFFQNWGVYMQLIIFGGSVLQM